MTVKGQAFYDSVFIGYGLTQCLVRVSTLHKNTTVVMVVVVVTVVVVVVLVVVAEVIVDTLLQTICHMKGMVLIYVCRKNYNNPTSSF